VIRRKLRQPQAELIRRDKSISATILRIVQWNQLPHLATETYPLVVISITRLLCDELKNCVRIATDREIYSWMSLLQLRWIAVNLHDFAHRNELFPVEPRLLHA